MSVNRYIAQRAMCTCNMRVTKTKTTFEMTELVATYFHRDIITYTLILARER